MRTVRALPRSAERRLQRVVPDGSVDLVWDGGALKVAGPDTEAFMSPLEPGATIVGLRFRPGIAGAALGCRRPSCATREFRSHEVLARRARSDALDLAVLATVRWLGRPGVRVGAVSERVGLSDRQLLRRFRVAVGYGPKTLDRVLRFQRFLAHAGTVAPGDESLARLAFDLGYSDQGHLTRECAQLSGLTPGRVAHGRERRPT